MTLAKQSNRAGLGQGRITCRTPEQGSCSAETRTTGQRLLQCNSASPPTIFTVNTVEDAPQAPWERASSLRHWLSRLLYFEHTPWAAAKRSQRRPSTAAATTASGIKGRTPRRQSPALCCQSGSKIQSTPPPAGPGSKAWTVSPDTTTGVSQAQTQPPRITPAQAQGPSPNQTDP